MKTILFAVTTTALAVASLTAWAVGGSIDSAPLKIAQTPSYKSDITTGQTQMSAAQAAKYKADYQAAKAQWAKMTPQQQTAAITSAKAKKIADLTAIERVGQNNDMRTETAAQSGALKAEADAAKVRWANMTPEQKKAASLAAWQKKRSELNAIERVGQEDDTYILPW